MSEKYRVHELGKFRYSDIGEYVDEYHTDRPLRNDELVELLNKQDKSINELKYSNHNHAKTIIRLTDNINQLEKEKEEIKSKAKKFVELYEKDFGKTYSTPPRSGKTVRIQLWIVRKILDEIGILELYGDME